MASPSLPPPPSRSTLAEKDGKGAAAWLRWFTQLWDTLREGGRALYYDSTGQSIPDGVTTIINFATADIAQDNVTTGAAWKFTAQKAGVYQVSAGATLAFATTGATAILILAKNGAELQRLGRLSGGAALTCISGSTLIRLAEGDYIDLRLFQNAGGPGSLEAGRQTWVAIHRLVGV